MYKRSRLVDTSHRSTPTGPVRRTELHVLFLERAHTGSDLEVYLPREGIMWMSETFHNRIYPSMGGNFSGHPAEWIDVVKKAEAMNA